MRATVPFAPSPELLDETLHGLVALLAALAPRLPPDLIIAALPRVKAQMEAIKDDPRALRIYASAFDPMPPGPSS